MLKWFLNGTNWLNVIKHGFELLMVRTQVPEMI